MSTPPPPPDDRALPVPDPLPARVPRLAMIARWKPVHLGHAAVLRALAARGERVTIGIGSANRYDARNPFTADETGDMLRAVLAPADLARVTIVPVPDLDDGPRWRAMVCALLGPLDLFATANGYVRELLKRDYPVVHPVRLVPPAERVAVDGTMVRRAMARGERWQDLVPGVIAALLADRGLTARFEREFGAQTRAE